MRSSPSTTARKPPLSTSSQALVRSYTESRPTQASKPPTEPLDVQGCSRYASARRPPTCASRRRSSRRSKSSSSESHSSVTVRLNRAASVRWCDLPARVRAAPCFGHAVAKPKEVQMSAVVRDCSDRLLSRRTCGSWRLPGREVATDGGMSAAAEAVLPDGRLVLFAMRGPRRARGAASWGSRAGCIPRYRSGRYRYQLRSTAQCCAAFPARGWWLGRQPVVVTDMPDAAG
jgi:hypothetical protein